MLVTFEDFNGGTLDINPSAVTTVSSYQHFDHDGELPDDMFIVNSQGLKELNQEHREKADKMRTSDRTIIAIAGGASFVVKGSVGDVKKALGASEGKAKK